MQFLLNQHFHLLYLNARMTQMVLLTQMVGAVYTVGIATNMLAINLKQWYNHTIPMRLTSMIKKVLIMNKLDHISDATQDGLYEERHVLCSVCHEGELDLSTKDTYSVNTHYPFCIVVMCLTCSSLFDVAGNLIRHGEID